ncbi:collagen alpha-1(XXI) chain-like [Argopecten irradians]|uniref:collagen alpha-1(XXI) chain-like n=1 Tax=Argopecten irradians TaxID=31199 RepID=UPI00371D20C4
MSMEYPKGDTNIAVGIDDAREMLKQQGRPTAAKYMVVFTDRLSSSPMHTYTQAFLAKADGIKIFAVGMGPDSSNEEMKMLASGPNSVFTIPDIASLDALGPYMSDQLCKGYMNSYAEMQQHGPGHLTGRRENSTSSQPKFNNMQP